MASQVEQWFRLADEDRDGGVGGAEAVRFFTKSGLPQDVLGQIWEYSSGGAPKLNVMQFGVAMRLVALAQASGNRLDPNQARLIAMGGGPQLPPPRLAGITGAPVPSIPTYTPQITGLGPQGSMASQGSIAAGPTGGSYVPQPTGGYVPQVTGGPRPPMPTGYQPQFTGMRPPAPAAYTAQHTGAGLISSGPPSAQGGFSTAGSGPPSAGYTGQGLASTAVGSGPPSAGYTGQGFGAAGAGASGQGLVPPVAGQTGQGLGAITAGPTGGIAGLPGFPLVTAADMRRYQATFMQTDTDRDGLVKGSECFSVFMLSGLDKALLKRMWDMIAGNAGSLNAEQFIKCMYIMDGCRRGAQLPAALPPGPWPQVTMPTAAGITGAGPTPGSTRVSASGTGSMGGAAAAAIESLTPTSAPLPAENWSLENQFGPKGAQKAIADAYDQTLPRIPELPGKFTYAGRPPSIGGASLVPDLDTAVAGMLEPANKARWEAERNEALEKERKQQETEAEAAAAKARIEAFQQALSELVMFKSRVDVALLQASDTAARLSAEAEDTELRYNRARIAAQSQQEEGNAARQKLQALLARKQEAANKLELLQQELAMMQNLNPAELVALEKEVGKLVAEAAAAESKKAAMEMQLDSGKKQKSLLADRISDLELAAAAGEGDIRRAREELEYLQAKVSAAQDTALSPGQLGEVGPLLGKAASAYRRLYSSAAAAGIEIPYEANLNNVGALVWLEQLMAGTADWVHDDSLVSGYTVVNALPDLEGVPPALLRAAALAAEQQQLIRPAAVMAVAAAQQQKEAATAGDGSAAVNADGVAMEAEAPAAVADDETGSPKKPSSPVKGAAVAAVAAAVTAAAVAGGAAAAAVEAADDTQLPAAAAAVEGEQLAASAEGSTPAAGVEADAAGFGDAAFGEAAAFPAAAAAGAAELQEATAAAGVIEEVEPTAADLAEEADMFVAADVPAAEPNDGTAEPAAAAAAAAAAEELPASAAAAAVALIDDHAAPRKSVADEDDSDIGVTSPFSPEAMSAVPAVAGGLGLAGFDPAMYRLSSEQRQLAAQQSVDSSYAGSITGGPAAGATGASAASGFEDDAFGDSSGTGQQKTAMAFEDNAF